MEKKEKEVSGYLIGFLIFVLLVPALMWLVSGRPDLWIVPMLKMLFAGNSGLGFLNGLRMVMVVLLSVLGLSLSVWSIVYMRRNGDGNPMDAFGHEVAPRTKRLLTGGPYRLSRNPMLTGTFIYYAGVCLWLLTWQALLVFVVFFVIMLFQVFSEERRLRKDFGEEYEAYCRKVGRFGFGPGSSKK